MGCVEGVALVALQALFDQDLTVIGEELVVERDGAVDVLLVGASLVHATHELERAVGVEAGAAVGAHERRHLQAAHAVEVAAVIFGGAAVGHEADDVVAVAQAVVAHPQHVLVELGVVDARADDDDVIGGEVGIFVLAEGGDIDGVDLGVGCDERVDELLGVAVVLGPVENDRSWIHDRAFHDEHAKTWRCRVALPWRPLRCEASPSVAVDESIGQLVLNMSKPASS